MALFKKTSEEAGDNQFLYDVLNQQEEKNVRARTSFWASSVHACQREAVLSRYFGGKENVSLHNEGYKAIGLALEDKIIEQFQKAGILKAREFEISRLGINLGGRIDAIVKTPSGLVGIEIKTCGKLPSKPKKRHLRQTLVYSAITGLQMKLIYWSRSVAQYDATGARPKVRVFDAPYDGEPIRQAMKDIVLSYLKHKNGILPDIPEHIRKSKDCRFCIFYDFCWGDAILPHNDFEKDDEDWLQLNDDWQAMVDAAIDKRKDRLESIVKRLS